jgi:hypothetical protein
VFDVKNVCIGENGIVEYVIHVSEFIFLEYFDYLEFILGTYGVTLPCEGCGGKSKISASC